MFIAKIDMPNIIYKEEVDKVVQKTIEFKNRETTAKQGKLPKAVLVFSDFNLSIDELYELYEAIKHEIGICSSKSYYNVIDVYINLLIDIEDILQEIKCKYTNSNEDYILVIPFHILELSFLLKALEDYIKNLQANINDENNSKLYKLNLLVERSTALMKSKSEALGRLHAKYDKSKRLVLLKHIWNNLYELIGED